MRSPLSGPIATLLMFVPLVAIPALAIFGMPQFSTASSAGQAEDLKFATDKEKPPAKVAQEEADLAGGVQVTESTAPSQAPEQTAPATKKDADPFAEFIRTAEGDSPRRADGDSPRSGALAADKAAAPGKPPQRWPPDPGKDPSQKPLVALGEGSSPDTETTPRPGRDPGLAESADSNASLAKRSKAGTQMTAGFDARRPDTPDPGRAESDFARGLKAAVARLNALGIRDYQFQPGEREGEIHFSCRFVSRRNPRVMQRFEAEAADPLEAVEHVLQQIDEWKERRTASNARTPARETGSDVTVLAPSEEALPVSRLDLTNR